VSEISDLTTSLRENYTLPILQSFYTVLLLYHTYSFLGTRELAGRDLIGAFSLVESFKFGWSMDWFIGFPMFRFYPPGFFFISNKLGLLLGDLLVFKLLIYLSLILFPLTVYFCFESLFDRTTANLALILSFVVVFLREPFSLIYQTLQVGLVAQMFALPLLFLYIGFLWKTGRDSAYILGLLMGLMVIIHPYIAAVAVLYTAIYFVIEKNLFRVLASSTGFLLTAWWWIPILEKSWYMQNYIGPTGKLANWPWLFLPFLIIDRGKKAISLGILAGILLLVGTFNFGLEIQFYRFYIYGQILAVLSIAPGLKKSLGFIEDRISSQKLIGLLFISILAPSMMVNVSEDWKSNLELEDVTPEEGRMIVETSHSNLHNSYVPIQELPLKTNVTVVNGLYADSSISSPYLLGLEKSFAENPVPNPIAVRANLSSEQLEERFQYFGIEYALVRTKYAEEKLSFMKKISENDDFKLLKHDIENTEYRPVPVKGDYSEWLRLNRQIFQTDLRPVIYTPGKVDAVSITNFSKSEAGTGGRNYSIKPQSIKPDRKRQALFGLNYTLSK
jgi:hypothetical protein